LRWYKVELVCSKVNAYTLEEILVAIGAISISMTNKSKKDIYEPGAGETPLWDLINISALFEQKILEKDIASAMDLIEYSDLSISELEETNWIESYQKNFQPIKIGNNFYVVPSWGESNKFDDKTIIKMDPGLAFGSGSHETTHLCLEYLSTSNLRELTVIDYGCGSGILGIAALLLGAKNVLAIDIDKQALVATKENARKNFIESQIITVFPKDTPRTKGDIVIANIFMNSLIELKEKFIELMHSNTVLVVSGVLDNQLDFFLENYSIEFDLLTFKKKNEWCLLEFKKH